MIILPVLAAEQLQKIVLMKVCAVEKFGGRGGGRRPTVGLPPRASVGAD